MPRTKPPERLFNMSHEPLLNDAEAARFLGGLHPKTVQRMARRGELPAYRIGRYWRYRRTELDAWLRSQARSHHSNEPVALTKEKFQ